MKIILYGDPRTKKNSPRPVPIRRKDGTKYTKILPSKAYEQYEADCLKQITGVMRKDIQRPVNVKGVYYMKTRRVIDLANLLEATCDILVAAGVLKDDNSKIVVSHDGSRVRYDKDNPRAEIEIKEMPYENLLDYLP